MDIKLRNVDAVADARLAAMVAFECEHEMEGHGIYSGVSVVKEGNLFFAYRTKAGMIVVAKA